MFNFSYTQEKYDEVKEPLRYYLNWTNIKGNFKYKDCTITVIGMGDERKRIIVRRKILDAPAGAVSGYKRSRRDGKRKGSKPVL